MGNNSSSDGGGGGGGSASAGSGGHVSHHHHHPAQLSTQPARSGVGASRDTGIRHLLRNNGALGLSKTELEARCQPSGLYPACHWEYKQIRRLIGDGKLAAREKGTEEAVNDFSTECPICFLQYSAINKTKCCSAHICTECYLQVRNPKESSTPCPFCNQKLAVGVAVISEEAVRQRKSDEQRVIEAQIRAKGLNPSYGLMTENDDSGANKVVAEVSEQAPSTPGSSLPPLSAKPRNTEFGASLEQNERIARLRQRSSSGSGDADLLGDALFKKDGGLLDLKAVAMTPAERQALEAEMKAQHQHPLAQRMQEEEAERRFRNEMEYINSPQYQQRQLEQQRLNELTNAQRRFLGGGGRSTSGGGSGGGGGSGTSHPTPRTTRDWNRIVEAFESGRAGNAVQSLDDLVVLEAAIMLSSMEHSSSSSSRRGGVARGTGGGGGEDEDDDDDDDVHNDDEDENEDDFATRHARAGFPLARARVTGRGSGGVPSASALAESLLSRSGSGGSRASSYRPWMMAALMSEEEQLAMAIAASLQDAPPLTTTTNDDDSEANNNNVREERAECTNDEPTGTTNTEEEATMNERTVTESIHAVPTTGSVVPAIMVNTDVSPTSETQEPTTTSPESSLSPFSELPSALEVERVVGANDQALLDRAQALLDRDRPPPEPMLLPLPEPSELSCVNAETDTTTGASTSTTSASLSTSTMVEESEHATIGASGAIPSVTANP